MKSRGPRGILLVGDVRRGVTRYDGGWGLTVVINFGVMMRTNVNGGLLSG